MMLIPTYVAPSAIDGVGMFAGVPVAKGTRLWEFTPGFDRIFSPSELAQLPELAREYIGRHGFHAASGVHVISGDHDQYVNHADDANMVEMGDSTWPTGALFAARDIAAGEELTQNYIAWDTNIASKQLPETVRAGGNQ